MTKSYVPKFKAFIFTLCIICMSSISLAQTTLTTLPNPPYNGGNGLGSPSSISFVLNNTNPFAVNLTGISNWLESDNNNSLWSLYYTATALSGAETDVTSAPWTLVANSAATPFTTAGISPLNFPGLSFTIPANTQYRFALRILGPGGLDYSGTGAITPNSFTGGGVSLLLGDVQIAGSNVGYSGTGTGLTITPRYFTGAVTFSPAGPCTNPPTPGTIGSTAINTCINEPFTLNLTGGTGGQGQTYQWQISPDNTTFTDIPGATNSTLTTSQTSSNYYRVRVTCGATVTSSSILISTALAVGGTFTINSALPTGGTNFISFNDAYNYIKCGINAPVVFNVNAASGPYVEQLIMTPVPGASATNTVTFNGNGRTISFTSTNTAERAVIKLDGADHIKFDNLVINATGTTTAQFGFGVHLVNDADSNAVTNSQINIQTSLTSLNYAGIVMSGGLTATTTGNTLSDGNVFMGNTITGGYYGFTCVGSTTAANRDNVFKNNIIEDPYFYGIYINGSFNTLIDSNVVRRPNRTTTSTFYGIYITSLSVNLNISRNSITNPYGGNPTSTSTFYGIYFTGVNSLSGLENRVYNNKVYNITGAGEVNAIYNTNSDNVWYFHNTLLLDGVGGTGTQQTRGFYQTTAAAGIRFQDNIVVINRTSTGAKYCLYFNTITSDIVSNYNDLYLNPVAPNAFTGFFTSARATLADWRTASSQDANSVANNPIFVNPANGNLKPTNAAIDNLGTPVGILTDILGLPRSTTTPDLGAYEFTPGDCTDPPTPGIAQANPSVVCEGANIALSVTGNTIGLLQTYQWQSSANIAGPYTNIGAPVTNPSITVVATTTKYYRVAITCDGGTPVFSTPVLVTVNPAFPAGTYTINKTQPTSGTNYNSFADAVTALSCGIAGPVVFNVVTGTGPYNEQMILESIAGTSATNTITFNGNGNTIAFSSAVSGERAVIKLRDADHIILDNLVVDATGPNLYGWGIQLFNNADSNIVRNCTVITETSSTSTNYAGIVMSASETGATTTGLTLCDFNKFLNNTVIGGYYGITAVGGALSTQDPIKNNLIKGNDVKDFYLYGIYTSSNENLTIDSNRVSRPTRTSVSTHYGIYAGGNNNSNVVISKNRIFNSFGGAPTSTSLFYGIYLTSINASVGTETKVRNNAIYNINGGGSTYGFYNSASSNVFYYHNTVSLDDATFTGSSLTYAFYQTGTSDNIDLKNNIFSITRGGSGNKVGIYRNSSASTITSNYNDFNIKGSSRYIGYDGTLQATLPLWQASTGQDANSLIADPFFTDIPSGDLAPRSPLLDNKGTPVGILNDILNAPRSTTTPDIGAWEFIVPPCTTPPVAGTGTVTPNSGICLGALVELNLVGNSVGAGQSYQWQVSTSATGPFTNFGNPLLFPDTTFQANGSFFYRAIVTCSGSSTTSSVAQLTLNPAFLAGTYTINKTIPASATNFTSFTSAVAALDCGITGSVFFDVNADTYNEQIRIKNVAGTSPTVGVTFRSANAVASSVNLSFASTGTAANYTVLLDSAKYITFRNITITAAGTSFGRVVVIQNTAGSDSLVNCVITAPITGSTSTNAAGIYADNLRGGKHVFKGNTITGGSSGIYFRGTTTTNLSYDNVIDSNNVSLNYSYGMNLGYLGRAKVNKNTVLLETTGSTNYGIYSLSSDTAYEYVGNKVTITGTTNTTYGMYFSGCNGGEVYNSRIANNTIMGLTGNSGTLYGMYQTGSTYSRTVNNLISISTTGATSYASYSTSSGGNTYHNNTFLNGSASTGTANAAAYFSQTSGLRPNVNVQNNIFYHTGVGKAVYYQNFNFTYSDYNTFWSEGPTLIRFNAADLSSLKQWRDTSNWDYSSIAIKPELISNTDLRPNLAAPNVWAIHGRGNQVVGNDYDFTNSPRPTTLTTGVPDMGAYEFFPTVQPPLISAIPPTPAAGATHTFMFGTDTIAKVKFKVGSTVPASMTIKRYSGVIPSGLTPAQQSMYFYTDIDVPAQGNYNYDIQQFYVDSWQGFIPNEATTKLGRTNAANAWILNSGSKVDVSQNIISDTGLIYMDKFTGLTDGNITPPPIVVYPIDSSNSGTRFWVGYGHHTSFTSNGQDMVLYLSTKDSANVTVKVNGTPYSKTYNIPANTAITSLNVPKSGLVDARLTDEGKFNRGISIESDVPIQAYAHIYDGANSGAGLLLPVGVYGYEYQSLNYKQYYPASNAYSWFYVIADRDSTVIEITPTATTLGGRPAGVPFQVTLNRGEVYNVMGTTTGTTGSDLSGSTTKAIANASGVCSPFAMFSGSSRTAICNTTNGDNFINQVFPTQAWGTKYLTFATANSTSNTEYNSNIWRVMVKDVNTVVKKDGVTLNPSTLVLPGKYYEFSSVKGAGAGSASYIEADQPVMMGQYMVSTGAFQCPGVTATGDGDPAMIYISPIEQGIKSAIFYNTNNNSIRSNYVNVILKTSALPSLRIDGGSTFTDVFAHPNLPGYSCVRQNLPATPGQHNIVCDSSFNAITYGLGSVESYGYNAGTLVKNLNGIPFFVNTLSPIGNNDYTCVNAPFRISMRIPLRPTSILWQLGQVPSLAPARDTLQNNPIPVDSSIVNGRKFYTYTLAVDYKFNQSGTFNIPITISHPSIEGCNNKQVTFLSVKVLPAPIANFTGNLTACLGNTVTLNGTGSTSNGAPIVNYTWNFGDGTTATGQNQIKTYTAAGSYNVKFSILGEGGCIGDTTKTVVISALPVVAVVQDSFAVCGATPVTFTVQNPVTGTVYNWYTTATGGTPVSTGPTFTIPAVTGTVVYFVGATTSAGCVSTVRKRVTATVLPNLAKPIVMVDSAGVNSITFSWTSVPGATRYEVSVNAGTYTTPSSGATGLTHTVTGLLPLTNVTIKVRAIGTISCQQTESDLVTARTRTDQLYIPNAFSPNGDGLNDVLLVYGYTIQTLRMVIFNQWGEKVFETSNQNQGWNGMYKGEPQPSGVYMYVAEIVLRDGSREQKKGSINLVR